MLEHPCREAKRGRFAKAGALSSAFLAALHLAHHALLGFDAAAEMILPF
jgi:hypothetical protein